MQHDNVTGSLTQKAFQFFFWFARFEAALKESGFLKNETEGAAAEPSWQHFVDSHAGRYALTESGKKLIGLSPERQVVGNGKELSWRPVGINDCRTDLCKVVRMLKTVRNNVFHGGKSGGAGWDQPSRTEELLDAATSELHALAKLAGLEADLWQIY
ncbi:hypothetical protein G3N58_21050 [Paraburkholderia sp. Ac-20342]|uniref:hypothetical protein n=1 Tax=Paraburkholderia sp. Ac-20342 TaxID=2703889 RepID=UPI00197D2398|nr:hypothetical protein [Paraburkholderia sp. Ac-20342]MBN3849292.1 hypothetical protein [Paraburkholderia sp. Ac-20342]